jgi:NAD(P)-dependent dehydrogenase (short-subunit alcohol dehydrogenase family)
MSTTRPIGIVVMTGATAGLGAHAAEHFRRQGDTRVILGARGTGPEGAETVPLDLASLESVRTFATAVTQRLEGARIDMLVLNAGVQFRKRAEVTVDGFEPTFAVNHLAHYLLAQLLWPSIAEGGRLVITTSDTHDPAIFPFAPRQLDPQRLAHPDRAGSAASVRAYAASKLCNILTARALAALDEVKARRIQVVAYNPGFTLGTKLGRSGSQRDSQPRRPNPLLRATLRVISRFKAAFYPGTPERAGEALAQLALGTVTVPPGRVYASLVRGELTFPDPSKLARNDDARDRLWNESAAMVGISQRK